MKAIKRFYKTLRNFLILGNKRTAKRLSRENMELAKSKGRVVLPEFDIELNKEKHFFAIDSAINLRDLKNHNDSFKIKESEGKLYVMLDDCKYEILTQYDVVALCEIYGEKTEYNMLFPAKTAVFDIGMHIADTTVFFASKSNVEGVWGYEPFKRTFEHATRNIKLNQAYSKKIRAFDYGLGSKDKELVVPYSFTRKIGCRTVGADPKINKNNDKCMEKIYVKPVDVELQKFTELYSDCDIVLKVDCEGAEYEIFETLKEKDLLKEIDVVLLEWHDGRCEELVEILLEANFYVQLRDSAKKEIGMLYAYKNKVIN